MWFVRDTPARDIVGQRVIALAPDALLAAVPRLVHVPGSDLLKVSAGEHLASILLTAAVGPPHSVDVSGGVDLTFLRGEAHSWPFGERLKAAVEIKSLAGDFRRMQAHQTIGDTFEVTFVSAADVLERATAQLDQAEAQLAAKVEVSDTSRNILLVIHTFDGLAVEVVDDTPVIGHLLPPVIERDGLETLWVLWHPDRLVYWSRETACWTDVIIAGYPPDDAGSRSVPDESPLMTAENRYLSAVNYTGGSPWLFHVTAGEPDAE